MASLLLISLAVFFLVVGHSLLLTFKAEEAEGHCLSISQALMPYPYRGKFASALCLLLSTLCIILALEFGVEIDAFKLAEGWKVFFVFAVFPSVIYGSYFLARITKTSDQFIFIARKTSPREWVVPVLVFVTLNLIAWIFF